MSSLVGPVDPKRVVMAQTRSNCSSDCQGSMMNSFNSGSTVISGRATFRKALGEMDSPSAPPVPAPCMLDDFDVLRSRRTVE